MSGRDLHPGPPGRPSPAHPATASAELPSLPPGAPSRGGGWRGEGGAGAGRAGTGGGAGARTLRLLRLELETPAAWDEGGLGGVSRRQSGGRAVSEKCNCLTRHIRRGDPHPAWTCRRGSLQGPAGLIAAGGGGRRGPKRQTEYDPLPPPPAAAGGPDGRLLLSSFPKTRHKTDAALSTHIPVRQGPAHPPRPPRGTGMSRAAPIAARTLAAAEEVRCRPGPGTARGPVLGGRVRGSAN